jgi:uncharacterized DUF497 family protein
MPRIDAIDIDPHILEKIESKHGASWEEVEQVCYARRHVQRQGRKEILQIFGQTYAGRYLVVFLAEHAHIWKVVTARDMEDEERRWYQERRRQI